MPAFFIHGAPDTHHVWDAIRRHLPPEDSIAVDLPGFGGAPPFGFTATKEAYVDWLLTQIESVGEPVDIVGHDWGCILSLRVASLRPDLIRSWAGGSGPINASYEWHPLAKILQTVGAGEEYLRNFDPLQFEQVLLEDGVPAEYAGEAPARVNGLMGECLLKLYRSAATVGADWQDGLANVTAPGLVIWGKRDRSVPIENADILAKDTRAHRILRLDAGHWWPTQQPSQVASALVAHWESNSKRAE